MNYRHGFHAGNFADVVKHAILARALVALARKETPFRYIDTHAGAGRYDLTSDLAARSPEWRDGIARLLRAPLPAPVAELLKPYLEAIGATDAHGVPLAYPGSPALAKALMRRGDRLALCEKNDGERAALVLALGKDARLSIVGTDGYVALNAYVPPMERRGLVLVDPPFEAADERIRLSESMARALKKWPRGCYVIWRPIKDRVDDGALLSSIKSSGLPNILNIELDVGRAPPPVPGLRRAGLVIVNPPFGLADEARALLGFLCPLLARGDGAAVTCEWLAAPV